MRTAIETFHFLLEKKIDKVLVAALRMRATKMNQSIGALRMGEHGALRGVAKNLEAKS